MGSWFGGITTSPIINDVSTDLETPPRFTMAKIPDLPEDFKPIIRKGYPDLQPLLLPDHPPAEVFRSAVAAAEGMPRWQLTHADNEDGRIEGTATTAILRFKDDFVIRITAGGSGSVVNMRSRSRMGKGDMGCNAARIHSYFEKLQTELAE